MRTVARSVAWTTSRIMTLGQKLGLTLSSKLWTVHILDCTDFGREPCDDFYMKRSARKLAEPDLGVLAARLLFEVQGEIFRGTAEQGFDDVRPRHGAVLAYLDEDGIRLADLARVSGRNKQTIAAIVDELENLGYVQRADDPADRRAKLLMPTERAWRRIRIADKIVADIEKRYEARLGRAAYAGFKEAFRAITTDAADEQAPEEQPG